MKINNLKEALSLFVNSAIKQVESNENGDYQLGNKCYENLVEAVTYLKKNGEITKLRKLLNYDNIGVRLWSATYLLDVAEEEAKDELNKIIALDHPVHSFTAEITLSEWGNGSLRI